VIGAAHAAGRKIGICGQAPSDYPEFARFLVTEGIDSLSLNPDSQLKTMVAIVELEQMLARSGSGATRDPAHATASEAGGAARQPVASRTTR
jgi:phosphoenolpyruvate-protein kinase (PTS system EI component)